MNLQNVHHYCSAKIIKGRLAVITLASALSAGSAFAADLPSHKSPAVPPAPIFVWTGFYLGFNQGFGGGVLDANLIVGAPPLGLVTTHTANRASGFVAGGQGGYNYQFANGSVLGLNPISSGATSGPRTKRRLRPRRLLRLALSISAIA